VCVSLKHSCITLRKAKLSFLTLHVLCHRLISVLLTYLHTYIHTYLHTNLLHGAVILEKLVVFQLAKKFPAFCGTRRFIAAHTRARHLSLSWANSIQSILPYPTFWRSIFILSFHLRLCLSNGLFPSSSLPKPCISLYSHPYALHNQFI